MVAPTVDPGDLTDAIGRWERGELGEPASPEAVAEVRHEVEAVARAAVAVAGDADLAANPIRLSKGRISALLACERHLVLTADAGLTGGGADEALHLGVLVDALAEHHVVSARARLETQPLDLGLALCRARGERAEATVAWVEALDGASLDAFGARLAEKQVGLLERWPAFEGRWWPRTQERATVALADGDVVLAGQADATLGGPPTRWPVLVIEVKSGSFTIEQRDDGLVYALLLALRDGVAPAGAITVTAGGAIHVEVATAARLATAARRVGAAITAAGELAGGRAPREQAGFRCGRCPAAATCATAAASRALERA